MQQKRLRDILPYQIQTTNELLTSRAGLICIAQLMNNVGFTDLIDRHFPHPQNNRGFKPSVFVTALVLMLHEGGSCLDDLRHIHDDGALSQLFSIKIPESDSMGDWLRRVGLDGVKATEEINKPLFYFHKKYHLPAIQIVKNLKIERKKEGIEIIKADAFLKDLYL